MERHDAHELSPEGNATVEAVDTYLADAIRDGRPIEALVATKRLGEVASARAKEAARVATEGPWSWTDVGGALGMTKQAAHEKLRERVRGEIDKGRSKLERAERAGHDKISRRASRGREQLDRVPSASPKVAVARERLDDWERRRHDKLTRDVEKAREELAKAERAMQEKLDRKS